MLSRIMPIFMDSGAPFAFDAAKKAASINLSVGDTVATQSSVSAVLATVMSLGPFLPGMVFACTVNLTGGQANQPAVGAGNISANLNGFLGGSNSFAIDATGLVRAGGGSLGNAGFTFGSGDIIRAKLTATQVQFSNNGGAYSALFTHGITGTLYAGVTLFDFQDQVAGAWG